MDRHAHGQVRTEVVDERILVMTVDRVEKKNAFTPKISNELAAAYTRLDDDPELFVGVLTFAGDHTTAGLEMPLFFGPDAEPGRARGRGRPVRPATPVDQAVGDRGAGHHLHDRDRDRAGRRHHRRRVRHALLSARTQARARAARRRDDPLRAARRMGQRDVPPPAGRRVHRRRSAADRAGAGGRRAGTRNGTARSSWHGSCCSARRSRCSTPSPTRGSRSTMTSRRRSMPSRR